MYIGLIGPQGISKSTSAGFARSAFVDCCPDMNIGPSRSTPEKISEIMSSKGFERDFTNWNNELVTVRPMALFINEFKNFVGRSPFDMINFLTDIYDVKAYDAATLARGLELIINPSINILMCETPDWLVKNIKGDLITGGIARRFVLVYELIDPDPIPFPIITPEARAAQERFKKRLIDIRKLTGQYVWGDGFKDYSLWYQKTHKQRSVETNEVMRGYLKSKHIQLFKVMMLLDIASDKPMFTFTKDLVEEGLVYLNSVELNMPKLSLASGRNELMGSQQKVLEMLEQSGGMLPEKQLMKLVETDLKPFEIPSMFRHLIDSGQVVKKEVNLPNSEGLKIPRIMLILTSKWNQMLRDQEIEVKKKEK